MVTCSPDEAQHDLKACQTASNTLPTPPARAKPTPSPPPATSTIRWPYRTPHHTSHMRAYPMCPDATNVIGTCDPKSANVRLLHRARAPERVDVRVLWPRARRDIPQRTRLEWRHELPPGGYLSS